MSDAINLVLIEGIDMKMEAWELIRLFFDADSIRFISRDDFIGSARETLNTFLSEHETFSLMRLKVIEQEEVWCCKSFFHSSLSSSEMLDRAVLLEVKPSFESERQVTAKELGEPGGRLLKSRKILAGTCLLEMLSRFTKKLLPYGALTGVRPVKLAMQCLNDGMNRIETVNQLVKATGMTEKKATLLYEVAHVEHPLIKENEKVIHLYIGIPFCLSRCLYCSFTSYPVKRFESLIPSYLEALEKEMEAISQWIGRLSLTIGSIYIGGGTPTAIDEKSIHRLLTCVNKNFEGSEVEFTVEAGRPDTISLEKLKIMKEQGVTRISINPQTMNEKTLRLIGRNHTPKDIEEKFKMARELGFGNINMDIIAGLPNETEEMFTYTLEKIAGMKPDGLTVHTMAVKRASRLREEQTDFPVTRDEVVEAMIGEAGKAAEQMGMRPYYLYRQKNILANLENTGYARPGFECLYNIQTMEEKQTILAMGAGAISKFVLPHENRMERVFNLKEVPLYIERLDEMIEKKKLIFQSLL